MSFKSLEATDPFEARMSHLTSCCGGWLGICKGVNGSELGSSRRGRGGVASSRGVPGASVDSVRVGVAHGDPYGVEVSDIDGSSEHKRRFFNGVGNSTSTK